ncbi:MAG TPA: hypothetical protein VK283_10595 [Acidimicrobiales bacterium]|nr:hypothetical protein [Acidimicrobiales bacterium]
MPARPGWPSDGSGAFYGGIPIWQGGDQSWTTNVTIKGGYGYLGIPLGFTETVTGVTVNLPVGASFSAPVFAGVKGSTGFFPNGYLLFQPPAAGCPDGIYDLTITAD